ncbi:MAG: ABC transporter ATP-binding protein [Oscillospiraceae bacterium]|nr:ABC transporter ATP-binding protein [Oscillospiraceae bacterium]
MGEENSTAIIRCEHIHKKYKSKTVLEDISFDIRRGEFLSLLGPSGCGKTTILRMLIGIERPTSGKIIKDGADITDTAPKDRNIGIVFQNYSLFPNMDVYHNISYALQSRKLNKEEIDRKVKEIVETVDLGEHIYKKPKQLSGGQQQRVAIARTLVLNPDIILFDEPMSALDAEIKVVLRQQLKEIQKKLRITMVYVTHDQEEAFALSDRIMVLNDLQIAQLDTPYQIYHNPADAFVRRFVVDHLNRKVKSIEDSIKEDRT